MFEVLKNKNATDESYHIISAQEPAGVIAEQYRKLRTNIEYSTFNKELKVINLTSTYAKEGKTVSALNLATVYAQAEVKTLIIDMDLRKPKIHRAFNIPNETGLSDIIVKNVPKEEAVHKASDYLHVLTAGERMPYPAEFLMSKKVKDLITSFKGLYDKIIIDTPPMSAVADATIVSGYTDGTIFVVASRETDVSSAETILKTLKENGANILGGVLTRVRKRDHRYMDYYYYYGE